MEHHIQKDTSGCKGKASYDATTLRNQIKQSKSKNDKHKKAYKKDSTIKALTDTAAGIEETAEWQTKYCKSKFKIY